MNERGARYDKHAKSPRPDNRRGSLRSPVDCDGDPALWLVRDMARPRYYAWTMSDTTPPNLPMVHDDLTPMERASAHLVPTSALPTWETAIHRLSFDAVQVARLREVLQATLPEAVTLTDDDIRTMARETLELVVTLFAIAQSRLDRGLPLNASSAPSTYHL